MRLLSTPKPAASRQVLPGSQGNPGAARRFIESTQRGVTLIELMMTIVIASILMAYGLPALADYLANSRLRAGGNAMLSELLYAQREAIKRNGPVRVTVSGSRLSVADSAGNPLRSQQMPSGTTANADVALNIDFGSTGQPVPFPSTYQVKLSMSGYTCSDEIRCPALQVGAAGDIKLCGNQNLCN